MSELKEIILNTLVAAAFLAAIYMFIVFCLSI
jgi:hypothetical protein